MSIHLTKEKVCEILSSAVDKWQRPAVDVFPCFHNETCYAECFLSYFSRIKVDTDNFVSLVTEEFKKAFDLSLGNIYTILEQQKGDGTKIFEMTCRDQFILRSDRTAYNRQIPGKSPKGLITRPWMEYNHWLLVKQFWQGFLWSQEWDFKIALPNDINGPIELFLSEETKPLWGMRIKAQESGTYCIGFDGDCIDVRPHAQFHVFFSTPNQNQRPQPKTKKAD